MQIDMSKISSDFKIEEIQQKTPLEVNKKSVNIQNLRFLFTHVALKGNNTNVLFLHYRKTIMLFFVDGRKLTRLLSTKIKINFLQYQIVVWRGGDEGNR